MKKKLLLFFTTLFCLQNIFAQSLFNQYKNQIPDYGCRIKYIGKFKKFALQYDPSWACDSTRINGNPWQVNFYSQDTVLTISYSEFPIPISADAAEKMEEKYFNNVGGLRSFKKYNDTINGIVTNTYEAITDTDGVSFHYVGLIHSSSKGTFEMISYAEESSWNYWLLYSFLSGITTDTSVYIEKIKYSNATSTDSLRQSNSKIAVMPDIFETAFMDGTNETQDSINYNFNAIQIGKIKIETGKIVACDIIGMLDHEPFSQEFPVGEFPVQLAIANTTNDKRIAFSRIKFSDEPVVKWQLAIKKGQRQLPLYGKTFYGYGVDAGVGMFVDEQACKAFNNISDSNPCIEDIMFKEMDKIYPPTCGYVIFNFDNHNLACFSSGYGDGTYATYIGYDSSGKPCRLLTDFGIIDWVKKKRK